VPCAQKAENLFFLNPSIQKSCNTNLVTLPITETFFLFRDKVISCLILHEIPFQLNVPSEKSALQKK